VRTEPSGSRRPAIPRRLLPVVLLTLLATLLGTAAPAVAGPQEGYFVSAIASARRDRGVHAYATRSDLTAVARRHAARMAGRGSAYHNPSLGSEVRGWRSLAENVGMGSDAAGIHRAFMNSSGHRANILSRTYTELGVGTATDARGRLYVVEIFRLPEGGRAPAAAPASRTTARQPARATRTRRATAAPQPQSTARRPATPARPRVDARALLGRRVVAARTFARSADRTGVLMRLTAYHDVVRITAG
jgi:hypothetical protein